MMAKRTIYLIRHGQYDPEVVDPRVSEEPLGSRLTATGQEQAERTAQILVHVPFTAIYTSPLTRAVETAQVIARQHPRLHLQQSELLKEITPPLPYIALKNLKDVSLEDIQKDRIQAESAFLTFFRPAGDSDEYEALICHGNLIRYFVCRALQISPLIWMNFETYNCSYSLVEIDPHGNMILLSYNESGHLPEGLKTQNLSPMGIGEKNNEPEHEKEKGRV
jgi:serine/threonine-protein phosphatase PGAM5